METLAHWGWGVWAAFRVATGAPAPARLEGLWESRCCSKAQAELFRPGEHGLAAPPAGSPFLPTLLVLLILPGLFWLSAALELAAGVVPMCCRQGPSPFLGTALPAWGHIHKHWTQVTAGFLWGFF